MQLQLYIAAAFLAITCCSSKSISELQKEQEYILPYLGGSSPYIPMKNKKFIDLELPETCKLNSVQLSQRHFSRFPTSSANKLIKALYTAVETYKENVGPLNGSLAFFNDDEYKYFVNDADSQLGELTKVSNSRPNKYTGETCAREFGYDFYHRYGSLLNDNETLTVFASDSARVKDTAKYFAEGFTESTDKNITILVISEDASAGANTLTPYKSCNTFNSSYNDDLLDTFFANRSATLEGIQTRLAEENPGLNLTIANVESIYNYCSFELNVKGFSEMCNVLNPDEFTMFDYEASLDHYYSYMNPSPNSASVASLLLNSSIQLLTRSNGNKLNLAWHHDTDINNFLSLAIFNETNNNYMSLDEIDFWFPFRREDFTPMGGNIILEDYTCGNETYVRYIINDSVYPLNDCNNGPGYGCKLDNFIERAEALMSGLDFDTDCEISSEYPQELTFWWDYKTNSTAYATYA
ncbi:hypothetical protein ACO0SA_004070 [Hanseniaspora valbyensis]